MTEQSLSLSLNVSTYVSFNSEVLCMGLPWKGWATMDSSFSYSMSRFVVVFCVRIWWWKTGGKALTRLLWSTPTTSSSSANACFHFYWPSSEVMQISSAHGSSCLTVTSPSFKNTPRCIIPLPTRFRIEASGWHGEALFLLQAEAAQGLVVSGGGWEAAESYHQIRPWMLELRA